MQATKEQKKLIHINAPTRDTKEEFVQWATNSNEKISTNDLSFDQANRILEKLGIKPFKADSWSAFDKKNPKHTLVLSLLRQAGWTTPHPKYGEVADLNRLDLFLKSDKSPVKMPLKKMTDIEVEKVIKALKGIVKSRWK